MAKQNARKLPRKIGTGFISFHKENGSLRKIYKWKGLTPIYHLKLNNFYFVLFIIDTPYVFNALQLPWSLCNPRKNECNSQQS